jgi:hypothetical protein
MVHELLKNPKLWNSRNSLCIHPTIYYTKKKIVITIPFASLKSAFETKGGHQSSPWFFPLSPQCILINRFPWCCNPISLLSIFILLKGNQDLSILPNDNGAFFSSKVSRLWWDGLSKLLYLSSFQLFIWVELGTAQWWIFFQSSLALVSFHPFAYLKL